jgi:hypothetical protein
MYNTILYESRYSDKEYESCNTCKGCGFIKNYLSEINKLNFENDQYNYNYKKQNYLAPYINCIVCHGTGKKDFNAVLNYTCCLNKNKGQ